MLTLSRGGAVSMVVLLVAALALRNPSRRTLVGTGLAVVAGIIVALGALLAKFSLGPRSDVYRESLEVWWENPWGVGLGRSGPFRSEEHTSELQSLMRISYAVFCLKKKNNS